MFAIDPDLLSHVIALIGLTVARTPAKQIVRERRFVVHPVHSRVCPDTTSPRYLRGRRERISDWGCIESSCARARVRGGFVCNTSQLCTFHLDLYWIYALFNPPRTRSISRLTFPMMFFIDPFGPDDRSRRVSRERTATCLFSRCLPMYHSDHANYSAKNSKTARTV